MKKLVLLLMLSPLLLAMTCDDDPSNDTPSGTWTLTRVTGGIAGNNFEFEPGIITWKFANYSNIEVVNNNPADNEVVDFFETGTYDYDYVDNILPNSCEHIIVIDSIDFGCQQNIHDVLTFTQTESDGYTLTFLRQ